MPVSKGELAWADNIAAHQETPLGLPPPENAVLSKDLPRPERGFSLAACFVLSTKGYLSLACKQVSIRLHDI